MSKTVVVVLTLLVLLVIWLAPIVGLRIQRWLFPRPTPRRRRQRHSGPTTVAGICVCCGWALCPFHLREHWLDDYPCMDETPPHGPSSEPLTDEFSATDMCESCEAVIIRQDHGLTA